jgi:hypothetical protein
VDGASVAGISGAAVVVVVVVVVVVERPRDLTGATKASSVAPRNRTLLPKFEVSTEAAAPVLNELLSTSSRLGRTRPSRPAATKGSPTDALGGNLVT